MRIIAISDTHKQEPYLTLPKGDMLIHCGDMGCNSPLDIQIMNDWFGKPGANIKTGNFPKAINIPRTEGALQ